MDRFELYKDKKNIIKKAEGICSVCLRSATEVCHTHKLAFCGGCKRTHEKRLSEKQLAAEDRAFHRNPVIMKRIAVDLYKKNHKDAN